MGGQPYTQPKLQSLVLLDVVLLHKAINAFIAENRMLQKITADCRIENTFHSTNTILNLPRLTHLDTSRQVVHFFRPIMMASLQVLRVSHTEHSIASLPRLLKLGPVILTKITIIDSPISSVCTLFRFFQASSSLESLQFSNTVWIMQYSLVKPSHSSDSHIHACRASTFLPQRYPQTSSSTSSRRACLLNLIFQQGKKAFPIRCRLRHWCWTIVPTSSRRHCHGLDLRARVDSTSVSCSELDRHDDQNHPCHLTGAADDKCRPT
jgi:hypothetical protein